MSWEIISALVDGVEMEVFKRGDELEIAHTAEEYKVIQIGKTKHKIGAWFVDMRDERVTLLLESKGGSDDQPAEGRDAG